MSNLTYREAIRGFCRMCCCEQYSEIDHCSALDGKGPKTCALWPFRHGKGYDKSKPFIKRTPLKAIHTECINCQGSRNGVENCPSVDCPLYFFRLGKNPRLKGKGRPGGNPNWRKPAIGIVKNHPESTNEVRVG